MKVSPRLQANFPHRLWASLDTSTCGAGNGSGSVCPLSSQETSRFLISRGREKNGSAIPSPWRHASSHFLPHETIPTSSCSIPLSDPPVSFSSLSCPHQPHPYLFSSTLNRWLAAVLVIPSYSSPEPFADRSSLVQFLFFKTYFRFCIVEGICT